MAPSPELGQPKAPDKSSSAASSRQNANDVIHASPTVLADGITNCGNNMTSTANTSGGNSSSSNSCSGVVQPKSGQNIKQMNDDEFLGLLDEAFSYKTPKDRENKSETFRKLLDDVERTKDHQFPAINETRYQRGSSNQHGGSLQDLKETGANDILDNDYTYGRNNRRHHHNWRSQKYSSSVSTRQREGGSLPSNVNASNFYSINEPRFLNEVGTKRRGKGERTFSGTSSNSGQDSIVSYESKDDSVLGDHTTITEIDIFEDAPLAPQGKHKPVDIDVGVEVYATMNLKTTVEISCSEKSDGHWVDNTINFPSLERSKANDATNCALPFDDSSKSCQSVLGEKPEKPKTAIYQSSKVIPQQLDENSNAIVTKKKKKFDADRNTTTVDLTEVEGYRGNDPIETLVKFIENTDAADTAAKKSDKLTSMASGGKKKEKKKDKELKKDVHKVKKSSSLEELRSCTKLDEDDKLSAGVIMRAKGKKTNVNVYTSPSDGKENIKQNTKRGERRSWGTEELTYLGENNAIEEVREKNKEKEKSKKAKEMAERQVESKIEKVDRVDKIPPKKKKSERSLSVLSMESGQSETAEFHVVTKKKRSKKRQSLEETRSATGKGTPFSLKSGTGANKKYQTSSTFANDRDAYLTSYNPHDSRRKTTSSVPPSEKSDSSDLDSVHSLPIESVTGRHQSGSSSQMQHQSYADIARTVNANKNLMAWQATDGTEKDIWPVVSAANVSNISGVVTVEAAGLIGAVQVSSSSKNRPSSVKSKSLAKDFPDLAADRSSRASNSYDGASSCSSSSSTSTIVKQVGYLQSPGDEKIVTDAVVKPPAPVATSKLTDVVRGGENVKQTLQKSKSADNERFYSVEQYPALEKTVKRHSTQNSISDIKSLQNPGSGAALAFTAGNQVISTKQRSPPTSSVHIQQQQQEQQSSMPVSQAVAIDGANAYANVADVCLPTSTNAGASSNSAVFASISSATSALSDTSKIVINNNLDMNMNTNIAATSSYSSNNLGNMNSSTSSSIIIANSGKKIKANTKASSELSAASLLDVNNAKNSTPQPLQTPINVKTIATSDGSVQSGALDHISHAMTPSINPKKLAKVDSQQSQQPLAGISTINRKAKKDRQQQNTSASTSGEELLLNLNQQTPLSSSSSTSMSQGKHSNRPAVIILNDASDSGMYGGSDFTFGDFNEDELRLFESNHQLDDSGSYNVSVPDVNSSGSIVSDTVHEDIHLSPHSDQGYSSSNNRSIFSESMDQNNIVAGGTVTQKGSGVVYMAFDADPSSVSTHLASAKNSDECRIVSMNTSPFPNDSAIIMASTSSSISSPYNSSSHLQQQQSNIVVTNLGTTHVFPVSSSSSSSASSSNPIKMLSNSIAHSSNSNKMKETKLNEHKYEAVTNDLRKNSSTSSDHVNNSIVMNNTTNNNSKANAETSSATKALSSSASSAAASTTTTPPQSSLSSSSSSSSSSLLTNNNLPGTETTSTFVENCTNNNYATNRTAAAGTAATTTNMHPSTAMFQPKSNCDMLKRIVNNRKEINIRFVAPAKPHAINSANYEKLVDFVGLAWEDILLGVNGETEYYDGQ